MAPINVRWLTAFLDRPAPTFDAATQFWLQVSGSTLSAPRGPHHQFATLIPADGDAYLRVQRVIDGAGGCHLDVHVDDIPDAATAAVGLGATKHEEFDDVSVLRSPAGLPFCIVRHHGESTRPRPPALRDAAARTAIDQLCIDIAPDNYQLECDFWEALTGWQRRPARLAGVLVPGPSRADPAATAVATTRRRRPRPHGRGPPRPGVRGQGRGGHPTRRTRRAGRGSPRVLDDDDRSVRPAVLPHPAQARHRSRRFANVIDRPARPHPRSTRRQRLQRLVELGRPTLIPGYREMEPISRVPGASARRCRHRTRGTDRAAARPALPPAAESRRWSPVRHRGHPLSAGWSAARQLCRGHPGWSRSRIAPSRSTVHDGGCPSRMSLVPVRMNTARGRSRAIASASVSNWAVVYPACPRLTIGHCGNSTSHSPSSVMLSPSSTIESAPMAPRLARPSRCARVATRRTPARNTTAAPATTITRRVTLRGHHMAVASVKPPTLCGLVTAFRVGRG